MPNFVHQNLKNRLPVEVLRDMASSIGEELSSKEFAKHLDDQDPLASFRKRFDFPSKQYLTNIDVNRLDGQDEDCIYLCGNSLGLKPKSTDLYVNKQLWKWAKSGVEMHVTEPLPALYCDDYGRVSMGLLLGADPTSVVLMNGLSVNLHLLLISFYQPTPDRFKMLIEKNAFPSDRYALRSQAAMRGFDPDTAIIELAPRSGEHLISREDILKVIETEGDSIAVICLSSVQYYTGQKFDMEEITAAGHRKGCIVGWDMAHAVGNTKIQLDNWNVDFACWCTYKYLNSGPGCIGGAYVNKKHNNRQAKHLHGWWSNKVETRFEMRDQCDIAEGVNSFRLSNPPPILVACVMASLEIFDDAGMDNLLQKQYLLTGYLEYLLDSVFHCADAEKAVGEIITPRDPSQRGCQLSVVFNRPLDKIHKELQKRGVVCDIRKPNVMRIAPVPLYNSFTDVHRFVNILKEVFRLSSSA